MEDIDSNLTFILLAAQYQNKSVKSSSIFFSTEPPRGCGRVNILYYWSVSCFCGQLASSRDPVVGEALSRGTCLLSRQRLTHFRPSASRALLDLGCHFHRIEEIQSTTCANQLAGGTQLFILGLTNSWY